MTQTLKLKPDDPRLRWYGAASVEVTPEYVMPWRLPYKEAPLWYEHLQERASTTAGIRLAFRTDATSVSGHINVLPDQWYLDLVVDDEFITSSPLADVDGFRFGGLAPGWKTIELWLPQRRTFQLRDLTLTGEGDVHIEPWEDTRPKWVTYGSSITHCREAYSPVRTWPAVVARKAGYNLTCLGYGGNEQLDVVVARMMRDLPADFISTKTGINMMGGSMGMRTFRSAFIGFVQIVREGHPNTPFAAISPIVSPDREKTPNMHGITLEWMRDEIREGVEIMRAHGDAAIHYVDGLELFGHEDAYMLPDGVHPSPDGYCIMGERFYEKVAKPIFGAR